MAFVIGIGGTGKWVLHYLRKNFAERSEGIPDDCKLVNIDFMEEEIPNPHAEWYEKGKRRVWEYKKDKHNPDLMLIRGNWTDILKEIQGGKGEKHPSIYAWLREDDASYYGTTGSTNVEAAATRRQISREVLFESAEEIFKALRDHPGGRTYIVGSIAGGTCCGSALDMAVLMRQALSTTIGQGSRVIGVFVLPDVFFDAITATYLQRNMRANCYAFMRELMRLCKEDYGTIEYAGGIRASWQQTAPFNALVLVDASRFRKGPDMGIAQSLADWLYRDITGGPLIQHENWFNNYATNMKAADNPLEADVATAVGTYRIRWEGDRVAEAILMRLAYETFAGFLAGDDDKSWPLHAARFFLSRDGSLPFDREFVTGILERGDTVEGFIHGEDSLLQPSCRTGDDRFDKVGFREWDIVAMDSQGELKLPSQKRWRRRSLLNVYTLPAIGSPRDPLPDKDYDRERTPLYPALNYYFEKNAELFCRNLEDFLSELMEWEDVVKKKDEIITENFIERKDEGVKAGEVEDGEVAEKGKERKGKERKRSHGARGLGRCEQALEWLMIYYRTCLEKLDDDLQAREVRKQRKSFEEAAKTFYEEIYRKWYRLPIAPIDYHTWLEMERKWIELARFIIYVDHFFKPLLKFRQETCKAYLAEIKKLKESFDSACKYLQECLNDLNSVRASDRRAGCWRFVTQHPDEIGKWDDLENYLFRAATKEVEDSQNPNERAIIKALGNNRFSREELGDLFEWKFSHELEVIMDNKGALRAYARPSVTCRLRCTAERTYGFGPKVGGEWANDPASYELVETLKEATKLCEDGGVKSLDVLSILQLKKKSADDLLVEINGVTVNADYRPGLRATSYMPDSGGTIQQALEERVVFLPHVHTDAVGGQLRQDLEKRLRESGYQVKESAAHDEILVLLEEHLIKPLAFTSVESCVKPYTEVTSHMADYYLDFAKGGMYRAKIDSTLWPCHVFLAEKNATVLERMIGKYLLRTGKAESLPTSLVKLFDRPWEELERKLQDFAYLYMQLGKININIEDGTYWFYLICDTPKKTFRAKLGKSLAEALASFIDPDLIGVVDGRDRIELLNALGTYQSDDAYSAFMNEFSLDNFKRVEITQQLAKKFESLAQTPGLPDIDKYVADILQAIMLQEEERATTAMGMSATP
ncbi:MAG: tubulin-like doman-containing protein [Thermoproteota archaeon]